MDLKYLVLVTGLPGTGKSAVSKVIAQELGWDLHTILDARRDSGYSRYDPRTVLFGYQELISRMNHSMARGRNVIIDALAHAQVTRYLIFSWVESYNHKGVILECQCPSEVSISRMGGRANKDVSLIDDPADEGVYWKCAVKYQDLDRFVQRHDVYLFRYLSHQNVFVRVKSDPEGIPLADRIEDIITKHFK